MTDLTFKPVTSGKAHIDIAFERYDHNDGDPFDGAGGTLAHAFFPVYGGDAHFDDSESWTIKSVRGTNLLQTATHEFGHSLGLSHSEQSKALMAPFYKGYREELELDRDDVTAIQRLYGKTPRHSTKKPDLTNRIDPVDEELCTDATIDSMVTLSTGGTYVFKGAQYWKLTADAVAAGYPRQISQNWGGLPDDIDASFTLTAGMSYFFKKDRYWANDWRLSASLTSNYISRDFEGIPDNVDAAFVWSGNGKMYFFQGSQYWRYPGGESYPRPISNWGGVPDNIDAAIQYTNGYTYFFKHGLYWRYDDQRLAVDRTADPPYPRHVGQWWFGCRPGDLRLEDREGDMEEVRDSGEDLIV